MTERDDAISDLTAAEAMAGLAWAWQSTWRKTLESYEPDTGHDKAWLGYTAFKLLIDRLDRVFSVNRFAITPDADPALGADILAQGLTSGEFERMPRVLPGTVVRDDLNGSPGWRCEGWRILLQSFGGLNVDSIPWAQKSFTKRRVARQPAPDYPMLPLDVLELPMATDVLADLSKQQPPSDRVIVTLVAAYAISAFTREPALYLGHPRLNYGGGDAWHWRELVEDGPNSGPGRGLPASTPGGGPADPVPDAPIRLRRPSEGTAGTTGSQ